MVNQKQSKRQRDIKTKLMAAICMLLVSSIMMVSTTYAWFTLSTAPEVTGITTAVGANGNLEMALMPKTGLTSGAADYGITSAAGDSIKDVEERNVTWGNLVELSDTTIYGLDQITLYPSALNLTEDGKINVESAILQTPQYGADGRVSQLAANTTTGIFDNKSSNTFIPGDETGVRAVGTASGMTDRQLSYRNARSAANTARAMAANLASQSLNNNGSALANIAIEYGMGADTAEFDQTDVASLRAIIDDLQEDDGILDKLETAYMQYILAYAASAATGETDTVWSAVKGAVEAEGATLDSVIAAIGEANIPVAVMNGINEYNDTVDAVTEADTALKDLEDDGPDATFTWTQIREPMEPLANTAAMEINGFTPSEVKANLGELVSSVTAQGGLVVTMATGGGVYADIADQSGDFTASITIERVEYNGIVLNNMSARMETDSDLTPNNYLVAVGAAVEAAGAPASGDTGTMPISDMYGYIIDLAFRTNAADSNLLLQVEAADRIYGDNTNEETMGHGASMTFKATTTDFDDDQVKALMDAIKIIFFDPENGTIYCYAGLDTANAELTTDGWTAEMYLYTLTEGGTTTTYELPAEGETATHIADENAEGGYREATGDEVATHVAKTVTTEAGEKRITDNVIMPLTQNTAQALSVLVYLDGNNMGNDDVAATASTSMTGSMNLQFASSATLVPMEYADLYIPGATEAPAATTETTAADENQG